MYFKDGDEEGNQSGPEWVLVIVLVILFFTVVMHGLVNDWGLDR